MKVSARGLWLLWLVGCGVDETVFIPDYAELYCDKAMSCLDESVLAFDGIASQQDCLAVVGPAIEDGVGRCEYQGREAKSCLKAMKDMACPQQGESLEAALPVECDQVLINCSPIQPPDDTTGGSGTPTGTTTGATTLSSESEGA